MSTDAGKSKMTVEDLAARFRGEMIPVTSKFSYFSTLPIAEEDLRQYLNDPISAISPTLAATLPNMGLLLAPYLEKGNGKEGDCVTFDRPADARQIANSTRDVEGMTVLALAIKDLEVADYHYQFYNALASVVANRWPSDIQERFFRRDFGHMDLQVTIDDPKTYTKPITFKVAQLLLPDTDILESFCAENEKDRPHMRR